jgi:hypothetical protein
MGQKFTNNAKTLLAAGISDIVTTITLTAGEGDRFPIADVGAAPLPSVDDWFKLMITDSSGEVEIIAVRTRASGSDILSDILRAQDGTIARVWSVGAVVFNGLSANDFAQALAFALDREWDSIPPDGLTPVSGNKTATADQRGQRIDMDGGTVTVPAGAFADGQLFTVYNNSDTARNLIQGAGVVMRWENAATGNRVIAPYGLVAVHCVGADVFRVVGAGVN